MQRGQSYLVASKRTRVALLSHDTNVRVDR